MKISFDQKHDILRIKFQDGTYDVSKEVAEGIILDLSKEKKILAIEIIDVSQKVPQQEINEITVGLSS